MGLTDVFINNCLEKSMNKTMGCLHMTLQGLKSTRKKTPDTYQEYNFNNNVVFCATVDPSTTQECKFYSDLCGHFPILSNKCNRYIYLMYVNVCNSIMKTPMNKRSDKYMICHFKSFTIYLKIRGINPGFHIMDNEASTNFKNSMTTMDIKSSYYHQVITNPKIQREKSILSRTMS